MPRRADPEGWRANLELAAFEHRQGERLQRYGLTFSEYSRTLARPAATSPRVTLREPESGSPRESVKSSARARPASAAPRLTVVSSPRSRAVPRPQSAAAATQFVQEAAETRQKIREVWDQSRLDSLMHYRADERQRLRELSRSRRMAAAARGEPYPSHCLRKEAEALASPPPAAGSTLPPRAPPALRTSAPGSEPRRRPLRLLRTLETTRKPFVSLRSGRPSEARTRACRQFSHGTTEYFSAAREERVEAEQLASEIDDFEHRLSLLRVREQVLKASRVRRLGSPSPQAQRRPVQN